MHLTTARAAYRRSSRRNAQLGARAHANTDCPRSETRSGTGPTRAGDARGTRRAGGLFLSGLGRRLSRTSRQGKHRGEGAKIPEHVALLTPDDTRLRTFRVDASI
jgi:hypothetical protein